MKKTLLYGVGFGAAAGLVSMTSFIINVPILDTLSRFFFMFVYFGLLGYIMYDAAQAGLAYGKRFLRGFAFSSIIGPVFGVLVSIGIVVRPDSILDVINSLGLDSDVEVGSGVFIVSAVFGAMIGAILFNVIVGAMWSALFALFFKEKETTKAPAKAEKEVKSEKAE